MIVGSIGSLLQGGVAYVNIFKNVNHMARYSPAFVYYDNLLYRHDLIAEAVCVSTCVCMLALPH